MNRSVVELLVASVLWGFGFIGIVWGLQAYTPLALVTLRFGIVALLAIPAVLLSRSFRRDFNWALMRLAFWPGFFLAATLLLQTWGLKYTSATNSGFLTTLYVLFTPFTESLIHRRLPSQKLVLSIAIALIGTALICQVQTMSAFNLGDILTIACAWTSVGQFMTLSHIGPRLKVSPFALNIAQSLWIVLLCGSVMLCLEPLPRIVLDPREYAFWGIFSLAFGASLIAFMLQIRAQRVLPASTASLVCLMESPFAAIFAALLLKEQFGFAQICGALLIFYSAILAVKAPPLLQTAPTSET